MTVFHLTGDALWARMDSAVHKVQQRLVRSTAALQQVGIPYAVVGEQAVQAWVSIADESAVRTTRDIDILIRRVDYPRVVEAFEQAGIRHVADDNASTRDAVRVVFSGERRLPEDVVRAPGAEDVENVHSLRLLRIEPLVRMLLTDFRRLDRVMLRDLMDVNLIDETWLARVPAELAPRLRAVLDDPDG